MFEVDRTGLDAGGVASAQDAGDCSCFLILLLVFMPRAANYNCLKNQSPRFFQDSWHFIRFSNTFPSCDLSWIHSTTHIETLKINKNVLIVLPDCFYDAIEPSIHLICSLFMQCDPVRGASKKMSLGWYNLRFNQFPLNSSAPLWWCHCCGTCFDYWCLWIRLVCKRTARKWKTERHILLFISWREKSGPVITLQCRYNSIRVAGSVWDMLCLEGTLRNFSWSVPCVR